MIIGITYLLCAFGIIYRDSGLRIFRGIFSCKFRICLISRNIRVDWKLVLTSLKSVGTLTGTIAQVLTSFPSSPHQCVGVKFYLL